MIEVKNLTKSFGDKTVLQDISGNPGESYRKLTPEESGTTKTEAPKTEKKSNATATQSTGSDDQDMEDWLNGVG